METLIIIDEQNDFVDPMGSLFVKGAQQAVEETIRYIEEKKPQRIIVTLDTHSPLHMDLPGGWNRKFDKLPCFNPDPKDCEFETATRRLVELGYPLVVWPNHCLRGSWGHALPDSLMTALTKWSLETGTSVEFIEKGLKEHEEMYSAFSVLGEDEITLPPYLERDNVTVVGVALDYCVKYSYLDLKKGGVNVNLFLPATASIGEVESYWKD